MEHNHNYSPIVHALDRLRDFYTREAPIVRALDKLRDFYKRETEERS
jgi:hypothetical protein